MFETTIFGIATGDFLVICFAWVLAFIVVPPMLFAGGVEMKEMHYEKYGKPANRTELYGRKS